jgi:HAE1 family hydrophobic/amphiphilic exporter-1
VLRHKSITIVAIFALFLSSLLLVVKGFIGSAFIEQGDRGEIVFYVETANDNTLAYTDSVTKKIEERFMKMPEVATVLTSVGVSGSGRDAGGLKPNKSELTVQLKEDARISDAAFAMKVKHQFNDIPGATVTDALLDINGSAGNLPVQILISSDERAKALEYGKKVLNILENTNGTSNPELSVDDAVTEVQVKINKEKMADFGLNVAGVGATMATAFGGTDDYTFSQDGVEYDIVVQLKSFDRRNPEDIKALTFINNQGQIIRLDQFASIGLGNGASQLERTDRINSVLVQSNLKGRQIGEVSPEIDEAIAAANFPSDVSVMWMGESADQKDSFGAIGGAFGLSLILMYLLMVLLYDNYIYPLVVLFAIPMSFIGAFLALALAKSSLTIFTIMGFVVMMGLVSKNAILIVDFANKEKADGKDTFDALISAGKERLRPILMTTLAMVFGLLPVAVATGAGAAWKNGLGWALVGGLSSSMCLTVFIVPAVYMIVDMMKGKGKSNVRQETI